VVPIYNTGTWEPKVEGAQILVNLG
jgi:hypothetical protein